MFIFIHTYDDSRLFGRFYRPANVKEVNRLQVADAITESPSDRGIRRPPPQSTVRCTVVLRRERRSTCIDCCSFVVNDFDDGDIQMFVLKERRSVS